MPESRSDVMPRGLANRPSPMPVAAQAEGIENRSAWVPPTNSGLPVKPYQANWEDITGHAHNGGVYGNPDVDHVFNNRAGQFDFPGNMPNGVAIDQEM